MQLQFVEWKHAPSCWKDSGLPDQGRILHLSEEGNSATRRNRRRIGSNRRESILVAKLATNTPQDISITSCQARRWHNARSHYILIVCSRVASSPLSSNRCHEQTTADEMHMGKNSARPMRLLGDSTRQGALGWTGPFLRPQHCPRPYRQSIRLLHRPNASCSTRCLSLGLCERCFRKEPAVRTAEAWSGCAERTCQRPQPYPSAHRTFVSYR